jgi:hypothetical protein
MKHEVRVRQVNPRDYTFRNRRGQPDHGHTCDGYQGYCSCGWSGEVTGRPEANADAKGHEDNMWSREHIFDKTRMQWVDRDAKSA